MLKETKLGTKMTFSLKLRVVLQIINLFKHLCYRKNSMILLSIAVGTIEVYFARKQTKKGNLF